MNILILILCVVCLGLFTFLGSVTTRFVLYKCFPSLLRHSEAVYLLTTALISVVAVTCIYFILHSYY